MTKKIPKMQIIFCDSPYLKTLIKYAQTTFVRLISITTAVFFENMMAPMKKYMFKVEMLPLKMRPIICYFIVIFVYRTKETKPAAKLRTNP